MTPRLVERTFEHNPPISGPGSTIQSRGEPSSTSVLDCSRSEPHFEIELLEFDPTPADDPGEHPTNRRRREYNHLAFRVDDISAATAHLVANGVTLLSEEMDYINRRLRFLEGPEGITLELVESVELREGDA